MEAGDRLLIVQTPQPAHVTTNLLHEVIELSYSSGLLPILLLLLFGTNSRIGQGIIARQTIVNLLYFYFFDLLAADGTVASLLRNQPVLPPLGGAIALKVDTLVAHKPGKVVESTSDLLEILGIV